MNRLIVSSFVLFICDAVLANVKITPIAVENKSNPMKSDLKVEEARYRDPIEPEYYGGGGFDRNRNNFITSNYDRYSNGLSNYDRYGYNNNDRYGSTYDRYSSQYNKNGNNYEIPSVNPITNKFNYMPGGTYNPSSGPGGSYGGSSGSYGGSSGSYGGPSGSYGNPSGSFGGPSGSFGGPSGSFGGPSGSFGPNGPTVGSSPYGGIGGLLGGLGGRNPPYPPTGQMNGPYNPMMGMPMGGGSPSLFPPDIEGKSSVILPLVGAALLGVATYALVANPAHAMAGAGGYMGKRRKRSLFDEKIEQHMAYRSHQKKIKKEQ